MKRAVLAVAILLLLVGLAPTALGAAGKTVAVPQAWAQRAGAVRASGLQAQGLSQVGAHAVRVAGEDRYATAVEISRVAWTPEETTVVFLASGESFPDALGMGASTLQAGPVLLTMKTSLPAIVAEELRRLSPCLVVAVGGSAALEDAVIIEADRYTRTCE
jgi:hypothetical protein